MSSPSTVLIPCKLDAFILNDDVSGGSSTDPNNDKNKGLAKIAPLTQPNYTFLRFEQTMVQNDILDYADLHKTGPAPFNPRMYDLGTGLQRKNRQGVYIHWMVPRPYRLGSTMSQNPTAEAAAREKAGFKPKTTTPGVPATPSVSQGDIAAPEFNPAPSRWLVIRKVEQCVPAGKLPEVDAWVVESDRWQPLDQIGMSTTGPNVPEPDLQVDYAPYLTESSPDSLNTTALAQQAEVFIGYRESASTWTESFATKPRVKLNLLNSSNQLFADYQPHNGNVFSIVDTLTYSTGNSVQSVESAEVSYHVLGWHWDPSDDPFGSLNPKNSTTRGDRLAALNMFIDESNQETVESIKTWLGVNDAARVVCHGTMFNVLWTKTGKPQNVPADECAMTVGSQNMAVAVGTTPMDAILTYCKSHASPNAEEAADQSSDVAQVEADLLRIQKLLYARDDGVDAQDEAADMVYNWNYSSTAGGGHYFLSSSDGDKSTPTAPNATYISQLEPLNNEQRYLDSLLRQVQLLRWQIFALWWQFMSDATSGITANQVRDLSTQLQNTINQVTIAQTWVQRANTIPSEVVQLGVLPAFNQARDATMLVAGVESGWPSDYLNQLKARLDDQMYFASGTIPPLDTAWQSFDDNILKSKLPQAIQSTARGLLYEFLALNPSNASPGTPQSPYVAPLYHDTDPNRTDPNTGGAWWRDRFNATQAWFPLFLEWQAEYTHIPFPKLDADWTLDQRSAWGGDPVKLRYGIKDGVELSELQPPLTDRRTLSGRVLILPQPNFNLQTLVDQVLETLPGGYLDAQQIADLKNNLNELAFLSSPLSGFTDHLLTRVQGNHVKPTMRYTPTGNDADNSSVVPFQAAIAVGSNMNFGANELEMMGIATDLTPYSTLVPYLNQVYCPFKPATHGQFRFTAVNIIDKFGQAVCAIDPTPVPDDEGPPPLYPCISEYYTPEASSTNPNVANTVVKETGPNADRCQYVQLPPSINQPARLNSTFIDWTSAGSGWQPVSEWDSPIWGWVVPNYADSGIQLFLPDGTFFREIRLGGPSGATESGAWLPFEPPSTNVSSDPNAQQLQKLAEKLSGRDYLQSFTAMINTSMGTSAPPPNAYSEFLSSLIGKPLALVKMGISLELASDEYQNQCALAGVPTSPDMHLLAKSPNDPQQYTFQVQFGDASRVYDGLIAYFLPSTTPQSGDVLELDTLYTHFVPSPDAGGPSTPNLTQIASSNYPTVSPFWIDPMSSDLVSSDPKKPIDPGPVYAQKWNAALQPFGALIDPFVAMHTYSGILPTQALQLPSWTWQKALAKMTAFFHMGPLLTTGDVPKFNVSSELTSSYDLTNPKNVVQGSGLGVPTLQAGEWAWLQPYSVDTDGNESNAPTATTAFMAMDMAAVDQRPRFEPAPYVAVEGYMQLRESIGQAITPSAAS